MRVNHNDFKPIGKYVLIRLDDRYKSEGNIIIPDAHRKFGWFATVLKRPSLNGIGLKTGDRIIFLMDHTQHSFEDITVAVADSTKIVARLDDETDADGSYEAIIPLKDYILIQPDAVIAEKDGIYLPDKSVEKPYGGKVLKTGDKCEIIVPGQRAYYFTQTAVRCEERGVALHIMNEAEIVCVTENEGDDDG